ncbi:hypothetical protein [Nocardia beijingensis]|uniref:Uncharacterized protein n=1 Tax=Nocardia beijingensis TaxID=95162 RepID=A0ABW7WKI3_9NOCA
MEKRQRIPGHAISIEIPPGYHELPLTDIATAVRAAEPVLLRSTTGSLRDSVPATLGTLEFLLGALAIRSAVYCGIGMHRSDAGQPVTSWLTISCIDAGEPRNPRLVILDLVQAKLREEVPWRAEPVDIEGRPVLFTEGVRRYPAPNLPAAPDVGDDASAFQLEALIPSSDGKTVAVIEVATASLEAGPEFAPMLFMMAASLEFETTVSGAGSLDL